MSAKKLYETLISSGIIGATGETNFELHGLKTLVRDSSIVGNVIQEWLKAFMKDKKIPFRIKTNSQEFPDFLMNPKNDQIDLIEVKCFKKSPNFDVANFLAYCRSLTTAPYRLDADYLIFKYEENETGIVITDIWLKKVWEICSPSERSPLKIQWKQSVPFNIRPSTWYAKKPKYLSFASRLEFTTAIKQVLDTSSIGGGLQRGWITSVKSLYKTQTGSEL
jgi:NgoBV restriction endonuclease